MVAKVEVWVILPGRMRQPKGRENRLLAVAGEQVQAFKKSVHQRFTGDMPLINRACTDVQRLLRFLAVQKRSIERGQAAIRVFARHVASSGYRLDRLRDIRVLTHRLRDGRGLGAGTDSQWQQRLERHSGAGLRGRARSGRG